MKMRILLNIPAYFFNINIILGNLLETFKIFTKFLSCHLSGCAGCIVTPGRSLSAITPKLFNQYSDKKMRFPQNSHEILRDYDQYSDQKIRWPWNSYETLKGWPIFQSENSMNMEFLWNSKERTGKVQPILWFWSVS